MTDQSKPTTELKPCPFCGGQPAGYKQEHVYAPKTAIERGGKLYKPTMSISCTCGLQITRDADLEEKYGEKSYDIIHKAWNTRADLVPAAPTGDKAAALRRVMMALATNGIRYDGLKKDRETLQAALQENTAPDDLVNALEHAHCETNQRYGYVEGWNAALFKHLGNK
ncbi:Lar family restriction alleviation protein [Dyadobacter psychrotolerans]|uniref:Uncharacterized protein n=1 Tax=Dyadobacter psychrotolerans TaxID=2541721 RepID=A0A4R5DT53_9BACT|nr:Lar family restriction alleviation protein [Dyadobacter psychrotolerans]TDE17696.1 hypothetical protein E0F88_07345 [Dyadobacter psychrotolerans]